MFEKYDLDVVEGARKLNEINDLDSEAKGKEEKRKRQTISFGLILR